MLKHRFAVVLASGLVLGGGTMAWAASGASASGPTSATHEQVDPLKSAAFKRCFATAGVVRGQEPTQAQRQAFKACLAPLGVPKGDFHGPGDATVDPAKKAAVKNCFSNTGVVRGEAPTDAQREALKACVAAAGITTGEHHDAPGDHDGSRSESQ